MSQPPFPPLLLVLPLFFLLPAHSTAELLLEFKLPENSPVGTTVGLIPKPPHLIIPIPGSSVDTDLTILDNGEIRTRIVLDRELRDVYNLVALTSGESIRVTIKVLDQNDNRPLFSKPEIEIEFPENTPRDTKRTLIPAVDKDLGVFNTQRYSIKSGNVNSAFRLSSHRERDSVLYLDLQVNGFLDRETTPFYNLVIEAFDGGEPPSVGTLKVKIKIKDANDNAPVFNQSKYFASISENSTVGTRVLQVYATDTDENENGRVEYSIKKNSYFNITGGGVVVLARPLDFQAKELHELIVVARDCGAEALETTIFASIRVLSSKENKVKVDLVFLTEDGAARISEKSNVGEYVARIEVKDKDNKVEARTCSFAIDQPDFGVKTENGYYVVTRALLDREVKAKYNLTLTAVCGGLRTLQNFLIDVKDYNDNPPIFGEIPAVQLDESTSLGTVVLKLEAKDKDEGLNGMISYRLENYEELFAIEGDLVKTRSLLDCEAESEIKLRIRGVDGGVPALSSSAIVPISIYGDNNPPVFEFSFYNVSLREDLEVGASVLNVTASDPDCGINSIITYTVTTNSPFQINQNGEITLLKKLDYEEIRLYEIQVLASDRGNLSSTTNILINTINVNDNKPEFKQKQQNLTLKRGFSGPLLLVSCEDKDGDRISYTSSPSLKIQDNFIYMHNVYKNEKIKVSCSDGKYKAEEDLVISVNIMDENLFEMSRYNFSIGENEEGVVGRVAVKSRGKVTYKLTGHQSLSIDSAGVISTKPLDYEVQDFILLNVEASANNVYSHCQVLLQILDKNDNPPHFQSKTLLKIPENARPNSTVYAVHATDADSGENGRITYSLQHPVFKIRKDGGLVLLKSLDYEATQTYKLEIIAVDNGKPKLSSTLSLTVEIQDVNDNEPIISDAYFQLSESTLVGAIVGQITAKDKDSLNNGKIDFKLNNYVQEFELSSAGILRTRKSLDFETRQGYKLNVTAFDHGSPPLSTWKLIEVKILDENDNGPEFQRGDYTFYLDENYVGVVGKVEALDKDSGLNGLVNYRAESGVFAMSGDGVLTTTAALDREKQEYYELEVVATDSGSPSKQTFTTIKIIVQDLNDNYPSEPDETLLQIKEGEPEGTELTRIVSFDPDAGRNGSLTFEPSTSPDWNDFTLDARTGIIRTKIPLSFERNQYNLVVHIRDEGQPPLETIHEYTVQVLELNDNRPSTIKRKFYFETPETTGLGSIIGSIRTPGKYRLINAIPSNQFSIYSNGSIYAQSQLTPTTVKLEIRQTKEWIENYITAEILVKPVPHPPTLQTIYNVTLNENSPIGTELLNLSDSSAHFKISRQTPASLFRISRKGRIYTTGEIDYEAVQQCLLVVTASVGNRTSSTTVLVNVVDLNDNTPAIVSEANVTVYKAMVDSVIHSVIGIDQDSGVNGQLVYTLDNSEYFEISPTSGDIRLKKAIEHGTYHLNVSVEDRGLNPRSTFQSITIHYRDFSGPRFMENYSVNLLENSLIGSEILKISAGNSSLTYSLPLGQSDARFKVTPSGSLRINKLIDREDKSSYELKAFASSGHQSIATLIKLKVKDVNDNAPDFGDSCHNLVVPENQMLGVIHTFKATDKDAGRNAEVSYALSSDLFSIDVYNGRLSSLPLDRERQAEHVLIVTAQDRGLPIQRSVCNFSVIVQDENDSSPEFSQGVYTASLSEGAAVGTRVMQVKASDADVGRNAVITYSIANETNGHFSIDQNGVIRSEGILDREKQSKYRFEVVATDGGLYDSRSTRATINININDVNDNRPKISGPTVVNIQNSVKQGQSITIIKASDADEGINAELQYSLETNPNFRISSSGLITTTRTLPPKIYHAIVIAKDKGSPSLSSKSLVEINVGGITDFLFPEPYYKAIVGENASPGTEILSVGGRNDGKISYRIVSGNDDNQFEVDSSGLIRVRGQLDREVEEEFSLVVTGRDGDKLSHTVVNISLTDENDNLPIFNQNPYFASIWEGNNKGTFVTQVSATDADSGQNKNLIYHIVDGNQDNAFIIEQPTIGIIKTNIVLDREIQETYKLTIIAMDDGLPQQTGTTTLILNVIDINDTPPTFPPSTVLKLLENATIGSIVTNIRANDVDTNPDLIYEITQNWNDSFAIGKYSGNVYLLKAVDYEVHRFVKIEVQVSDSVHAERTEVSFEIVDCNDNHPIFEQLVYEVDVDDTTKPGTLLKTIKATDKDSGLNSMIKYHFDKNQPNLRIDDDGNIFVTGRIGKNLEIDVVAVDGGEPSLRSKASLLLSVDSGDSNRINLADHYKIELNGDEKPGTAINQFHIPNSVFEISSGTDESCFAIDRSSGKIYITRQPRNPNYKLMVAVQSTKSTAMTTVSIQVKNILTPMQTSYNLTVSEGKAIGSKLYKFPISPIEIISGDDDSVFTLSNGSLELLRPLDYEKKTEYNLVIGVLQSNSWSLAKCKINIQNTNDNPPYFPWTYNESIPENEPSGTFIFTARAIDPDSDSIHYSLLDNNFEIDGRTGSVKSRTVFDYEAKSSYQFQIRATDVDGKTGAVMAVVQIDSRDEFRPEFKNDYKFTIPSNAVSGHVIGQIQAFDRDGGLDGRIVYSTNSSYVRVNRSGIVVLRRMSNLNGTRIDVTASSGFPNSKSAKTTIQLMIGSPLATDASIFNIIIIATTLLIIFVVIIVILKLRSKKEVKTDPEIDYVSTIQPEYYPRRSNSTGSELSNQTSSGRGSADDLEDEEIAMINEGLEEGAKNAQEYFERLGIVPKVPDDANNHGPGSANGNEDVGPYDVDISHLIYTQIDDVDFNGSVNSVKSGGDNWDYLLDWGPQYQPLAQVFQEISKMEGNNGNGSSKALSDVSSEVSKSRKYPVRSPIAHTHDSFDGPMRPSFSPALSPLANNSPSISPMVVGPSVQSFYK